MSKNTPTPDEARAHLEKWTREMSFWIWPLRIITIALFAGFFLLLEHVTLAMICLMVFVLFYLATLRYDRGVLLLQLLPPKDPPAA